MTATPYTVTLAGDMLHECLVGQDVTANLYKEFPGLAILNKRTDFHGRSMPIPCTVANVRGTSSTFSSAQDYSLGTSDSVFQVTLADKFGVVRLSDKLLAVADDDRASFVDLLDHQINGAFRGMTKAAAIGMYRDTNQCRGIIDTVSTTAILLKTAGDVANFEVGDYLQFAATDGGTLIDTSATCAISAITRATGTGSSYLYAAANWASSVSSIATTNYIYIHGDGAHNSTAKGISGMLQWCPTTASASASLFGVTTTDSLLQGFRVDASAMTMEEAVLAGVAQGFGIMNYDTVFMNPYDFRRLINSMSSKASYEMIKGTSASGEQLAHLGFQVLIMGNAKVVPDPFCPQGRAFAINSDHCWIHSAGPFPSISERNGVQMHPVYNSADWEIRLASYVQFVCDAPIAICNITLPS